jgi:hypothetical protein
MVLVQVLLTSALGEFLVGGFLETLVEAVV